MSAEQGQGAPAGQGPPPSEEELRAQLEEELRRITVRDVLVQTVVSLINLSGQKLGLGPETRELRDPSQVRLGIEAVRALLPLLEQELPEQVEPVREALSQLQLAYAREMGAPPEAPVPSQEAPAGKEQPTQGRGGGGGLWVPPGTQT